MVGQWGFTRVPDTDGNDAGRNRHNGASGWRPRRHRSASALAQGIAARLDTPVVGIAGDRILVRAGGDAPTAHAVLTLEWSRDLQRILGPPATALPR